MFIPYQRFPNRSRIFRNPKRPCLAVAGVLLFFCSKLPADEAPTERERIPALIRSLDASTLAERTRAERQILDLGPDVLSKLPSLETIESVAARESLRRIRFQLERRAAKESSGPSHVMLQGELEVREILEQIQQQTGNRLSLAIDDLTTAPGKLLVNWEKKTFWECLDDLCDRGQFQWQFSTESAAIQVSKSTTKLTSGRSIQRVGPFRIAIETVELRPVVGESRQKLLRINSRLSVEPRLRPLYLAFAAADLKGTFDEGQPLSSWNPEARYEHPVRDGGHEVPLTWDFNLTDTEDIKRLQIHGRIHCQIAAATERVVFDQTSQAHGTLRRRGGVSVRIRDVTFTPVDHDELDAEIGVAVSYDTGGPAFESHRTWIFHNAVYLETKAGSRTSFTEFETTQQSDGAVAVDYRWKKIRGPASQYLFVYEAPTLIIDVPVEIEFEDIPVKE